MSETEPPIRDAATVLLMRQGPGGPSILMGQRGAGAAFMPNKYVFPGGAVDPGDAGVPLASALGPRCLARLDAAARPGIGAALAAAAIRELWEETGLALGVPGAWPGAPSGARPAGVPSGVASGARPAGVPADWQGFAATGLRPAAHPLTFVFRAITPPGRPRRFDARFFIADAAHVAGDPDDFSRAADELSHLHWVPLAEARRLNLPFITEVVLAEVGALLARGGVPEAVPFFDNSGPLPAFRRLT
jgi:8-oxo-dGTP pyrophosphatase MutT (NUDIX family)